MSGNPVFALASHFLVLSLVAVGGGNSILPDMHRFVVDVHGWMTAAEFSQLYAIAQASPGPNIMVVTLIGWHVAGFPGAVASTLAICTPSSILAYAVAQIWYRFRGRPWARRAPGRPCAADGRPHPRRRLRRDARRRP
jgi:chromate transporter